MSEKPSQPSSAAAAPTAAKTSNATLIKWMLSHALRHPWQCLWLVVLNLVLMAIGLIAITLTGLIFDILRWSVDTSGEIAPPKLWRYPLPDSWLAADDRYALVASVACVILGWALLRTALRIYTTYCQGVLVQTILSRLRSIVYDKLQRLSFRFFDANQTGTLINRATTDVSAISSFAEWAVVNFSMLIINLFVNLFYMISIHPRLTLICLATTPLILVASVVFSRMVRPGYEENRRLFDKLILTVSENAQGQHVVKGFARQQEEIAKFKLANQKVKAQQEVIFRQTAGFSAIVHMLTQANLILVLGVGGFFVISSRGDPTDELTVGQLIVFASLLAQFSAQVAAMSEVANRLQSSLTSAHRVFEVMQAPMDIANAPDCIKKPRLKGKVVFESVSFDYGKKGESVLTDVSFTASPGEVVAILGPTGAGKSTLLSLIPRFYDPSAGRILIDDVDARELSLEDLRRNVGIVFQESYLFSNTVANNIAFGVPEATREQVEAAAKVAAAHEFIMELANGYDTIIGEQGSTLSGGQRQRLAIARAVLINPAILILDDATAAIDPETEHEILQAMENAMKGRTTFVVAHRLSTLRRADKIMILERGRIRQTGRHDELVKRVGHYREIAKMQLEDMESRFILQALRWDRGEVKSPLPDLKDVDFS